MLKMSYDTCYMFFFSMYVMMREYELGKWATIEIWVCLLREEWGVCFPCSPKDKSVFPLNLPFPLLFGFFIVF